VAENHPLTGRYTGINKPARWICLGQTLCWITKWLCIKK
jgi:hypothetical protein